MEARPVPSIKFDTACVDTHGHTVYGTIMVIFYSPCIAQ